ncbi:MAG: response regulator [Hyphomicrobiaceae bacterium]|nr:response regulator [Hyphomicrobiaceae bacterium]
MRRCLIVDDSSVVRKVAAQILRSLGCTVSEAESGSDAVGLCTVLMPDIIFLDWHMPGSGKLDAIPAIRAIESDRRPHIVYVTTEHDTLDIARALSAGADSYMMKPFDRAMLSEKLDEIAASVAAA